MKFFYLLGCPRYRILSEADRNKNFLNKAVLKCDRSLPRAWYRFVGAAGKQMPTQCVQKYHCGTHAAGWLNGSHPTVGQGIVQRRVCFSWTSGCCQWSTSIRVKNCGAFFVYEFSGTPGCSFRYCGDSLGSLIFYKPYVINFTCSYILTYIFACLFHFICFQGQPDHLLQVSDGLIKSYINTNQMFPIFP